MKWGITHAPNIIYIYLTFDLTFDLEDDLE